MESSFSWSVPEFTCEGRIRIGPPCKKGFSLSSSDLKHLNFKRIKGYEIEGNIQ